MKTHDIIVRVAAAAAGVVMLACSTGIRMQPARLVTGDVDFQGRLNTLARAYETRNVDQIMAYYDPEVYSLSFDLPYKFDCNGASHRASLQRMVAGTRDLKMVYAPNAEIWKTPERVWTIADFKASGKLANGDAFTFDGWHSAIWEPRNEKWLIAYEHFGGAFKVVSTVPPVPPPAATIQPPPPVSTAVPAPPPLSLEDQLADVFFDYDKWNIRDDQVAVATANAELLAASSSAEIVIEGHCDNRGTIEYNLTLGQRRADSLKAFLVAHGVAAERIKTVTFGKSRPFEVGRGEPIWGKNRRAHVVVSLK